MYISDDERKRLGFVQIGQKNLYQRGFVLISYNLVVAVRTLWNGRLTWISAKGYHDYSPTTAKQLTQHLGVDTKTRREKWLIIDYRTFELECEKRINSMREGV